MNCSPKRILRDLLRKSAGNILSAMQTLLQDNNSSNGPLREIIASYPDINAMAMKVENLSKPKVEENTGLAKKCVALSIDLHDSIKSQPASTNTNLPSAAIATASELQRALVQLSKN